MCLSPIIIKNPNYKDELYRTKFGKAFNVIDRYHDTDSSHIQVPCGHCKECTFIRQNNYVQRCRMESFENDLYMLTLTYKQDMLPYFDSSDASIGRVYYPDIRDVTNMFKRIRKYDLFGTPFKYFGVSEYGGKRFRPHFHIILSFPKQCGEPFFNRKLAIARTEKVANVIKSQWKRNISASTKKPIYKPLSLFHRVFKNGHWNSPFDFHYIDESATDRGQADVAFYVSKYILKSDCRVDKLLYKLDNLDHDNFVAFGSKKIKPHIFASKGFGDIPISKYDFIRSCIRAGIENSDCCCPQYINPDGSLFPMGKFLQKQCARKFLFMPNEVDTFGVRSKKFATRFIIGDIYMNMEHFKQEYERNKTVSSTRARFLQSLQFRIDNDNSDYLDINYETTR
jgi:hypothetical protein